MTAPQRSRMPLFLGGLFVGAALATVFAFVLMRPAEREQQQEVPEVRQSLRRPTSTACPPSLAVAAAGRTDGKAIFDGTTNASASIVSGKEAAAAGRDRDAEAAFLAACKVPIKTGDEKSTLLQADAKYNLARHYASLADEGASNGAELLKRAGVLLEDSLAVYQSQLGASHEKVKFAMQAISAIQKEPKHALGQEERVAAVSRPEPAKTERPTLPVPASKPAPAPTPAPEVARARPSFDCARARSTPERLICGDDELSSLDNELGQLYARAKRAAEDPVAFQRVSEREWRRREIECRTRECLLDWYAQRRRQLLAQQ